GGPPPLRAHQALTFPKVVAPAQAGVQGSRWELWPWFPAFAGMTAIRYTIAAMSDLEPPAGEAQDRSIRYTIAAMSDLEPHLLVVDDDARLRDLLRRYLSENGFRVTVAAAANEARANLASFAFDLIVLDVMMPGESGLDLTGALRAGGGPTTHRSPRLPILMLTAMAEPEDRVNGLEQGADDFLAKPFEPRELVLRIRNIIERRGVAD